MIATIALVQLVGYVILLLWGMHMVQSGVVRAFDARSGKLRWSWDPIPPNPAGSATR